MQEGVCVFLFLIFFGCICALCNSETNSVSESLYSIIFYSLSTKKRFNSSVWSPTTPPSPFTPKVTMTHSCSPSRLLSLSLIVLQGTTKKTPLSPLLNFRRFNYSEEVIVLNCYLKLSRLPTEIYWCCSLILSSYVCVYKMWFMCVRQYKCVA